MGKPKSDFSYLIINTLFSALNDKTSKENNYISLAILNNIEKLRGLSLQNSAILLNISESSLNRFCKKIGFKNFSTFRSILNQKTNIFDDTDFFQAEMLDSDYNNRIKVELDEIDKIENLYFTTIVRMINSQAKVFCIGSPTYKHITAEFQESMFMHGKLIELVECDIDLNLPVITDKDCSIIISLESTFLDAYKDKISQIKGKKILLMQMRQPLERTMKENFDLMLPLPICSIRSVQKYGLRRVLERIVVEQHLQSLVNN